MADQSLADKRKQERNIFADRMIRDIIVQVSLVVGLVLLVWFFTSNFYQPAG